jgi:hypothetical protein
LPISPSGRPTLLRISPRRMTRCVRRAFLLGEETSDRKGWIEHRIEELAQIFAVAVGGSSVMNSRKGMLEGFSLGSLL